MVIPIYIIAIANIEKWNNPEPGQIVPLSMLTLARFFYGSRSTRTAQDLYSGVPEIRHRCPEVRMLVNVL